MLESLNMYIICDGNAETGYGHFFRCLHLTNALKANLPNLQVTWVGALDKSLLQHINADSYENEDAESIDTTPKNNMSDYHISEQGRNNAVSRHLPVKNAKQALSHTMRFTPSWVLADSYLLNHDELNGLAHRHHLVAIDDFGLHSYSAAQAVLNFCVSASRYLYQANIQLLGAGYFLTNPRLKAVREHKLTQHSSFECAKHIMIAMGGFDRFDVGPTIALALSELRIDANITLLGSSKQAMPKSIKHLLRTDNMAALYRQSDLVISGGGLIKYESAYCATLNIAVSQTPEQFTESEAFSKQNLCLSYGLAQDLHKDSFITWFKALDLNALSAKLIKASVLEFATDSTDRAAQALGILMKESAKTLCSTKVTVQCGSGM